MSDRTIMAWGEIPVTDMDMAVAFYNKGLGHQMQIDTSGANLPLMAAAQSISQSPIR